MEPQFIAKIAALEELLAAVYSEKFRQYPDPVKAVTEYADYVQGGLESVKAEGPAEQIGMMLEAEFSNFFARVVQQLKR